MHARCMLGRAEHLTERVCPSELLRRMSLGVAGGKPTSPPGGFSKRVAHGWVWGKVGGGEEGIVVRRPLPASVPFRDQPVTRRPAFTAH